jgi:hypothetical protein
MVPFAHPAPFSSVMARRQPLRDVLISPCWARVTAGNFEPALAESWSVLPDKPLLTFPLRKEVNINEAEPLSRRSRASSQVFLFHRAVDFLANAHTITG